MNKLPHRTSSVIALCILGGLGLSAGALAEDADKAHSSDHKMKTMDADKDGRVSSDEHLAGAKKMFDMMDADKDGQVTSMEMDAAHKSMPSAHGQDRHKPMKSSADKIKKIDTDGDGVITAKEHSAGAQKMFTKMDSNKDGSLSTAEIQAGHDRMMSAEDH